MNDRFAQIKIVVVMILGVWLAAAFFSAEPARAQEKTEADRFRCPLAYGDTGPKGPGERLNVAIDEISRRLFQKRAEMVALMAAPEVDAEAARALQKEINELWVQRADRMLEDALQYKKENPNWQPRYWGSGGGRYCGSHRGRGFREGPRQ